MKKLMIVALAFLLLGCGTLNKDKLFSKNIGNETLSKEHTEALAVQQTINMRDSSNAMMELTIWPKGPFTFSPITGFKGEAFKMELKGKQVQLIHKQELTAVKRSATTKQKLQKESVVKLKEKQVEWEGMGYGVLLVLMVGIVGVWLVRKRLGIV